MLPDGRAHIIIQLAHMAGLQIRLDVEQRERPFLRGELRARHVGSALNCVHPVPCGIGSGIRSVAQAAHGKCIGKPGDTETDAALGKRFGSLCLQRIV